MLLSASGFARMVSDSFRWFPVVSHGFFLKPYSPYEYEYGYGYGYGYVSW